MLTEDLTHQLNTLLKYRQVAKVKETTFMFARPGNAEFPFRGHDCLREFATHCGLKKPECITSTKLRKQLAVLAQILNLKENSQDIIAAFQGHDIRIHREYYRLPESTLQIAKVSKLLHSVNEGTIHRFKGMDLDTMDLCNTGKKFYTIKIASSIKMSHHVGQSVGFLLNHFCYLLVQIAIATYLKCIVNHVQYQLSNMFMQYLIMCRNVVEILLSLLLERNLEHSYLTWY